jgi:hypothetical protein
MNNKITEQLGVHQHARGVNRDIKLQVDLKSSFKELDEYDIVRVLSLNEQFHKERNESGKYRIHGTIVTLSPLTGRKLVWDSVDDVFDDGSSAEFSDMGDYFDFYLCYPSELIAHDSGYFVRKATIISELNDFELLNCGFKTNSFRERVKNFTLDEIYELDKLRTKYNCYTDVNGNEVCEYLPVTEVMMVAIPKVSYESRDFNSNYTDYNTLHPQTEYGFNEDDIASERINIIAAIEANITPFQTAATTSGRTFHETYVDSVIFMFKSMDIKLTGANVNLNQNQIKRFLGLRVSGNYIYSTGKPNFNIGDSLIYDYVTFDRDNFLIKRVDAQEFTFEKQGSLPKTTDNTTLLNEVGVTYTSGNTKLNISIKYKFNPFMEIKIRDYSDFIETGDPVYTENIPYYAIDVNGEKLWRDLLDRGFFEQGSNRGVDYPFINGVHYLYSHLILSVEPDLTTNNAFNAYRSYIVSHVITHYSKSINQF